MMTKGETQRQNEPKNVASSQSRKFIDKVRELGADDDESGFEDKLKRLAKAKPKDQAPAAT